MNKTDLVEIIQKRTTQLTILLIVFVGTMMVFLVPSLIEEAHARITATATSTVGDFSNVKGVMEFGEFTQGPETTGNVIRWVTESKGGIIGIEEGHVEADIENYGKVKFFFENPDFGSNGCDATSSNPKLWAICWIGSGYRADASFLVVPSSMLNTNKICDMLIKFGGLEQTKVIREKLHC